MSDFRPPDNDGAPTGPASPAGNQPTAPPGWHPDPWQPGAMRWWSGSEWTELTSAGGAAPGPISSRGLSDVGEWFGTLFRTIINRAGHIFTLLMVTLLPANLVALLVAWMSIRDITITDANISTEQCPTGFNEIECALEVDIGGWDNSWIIPIALALIFFFFMYLLFNLAVAHQVHEALDEPAVPWVTSLSAATRALPRYLGYGLLILVALMVWLFAVTFAAALGGAALFIIAVIASIALAVLAWIKLSFFTVAAAVAPNGTSPLKASIAVSSDGRFGAVALRLFLLALSGIALSLGSQVISVPVSAIVGSGLNQDLLTDLTDDDDSPAAFRVGDLVDNPAALGISIVLGLLVQAAGTGLQGSGAAVIYRDAGGPARQKPTTVAAATEL